MPYEQTYDYEWMRGASQFNNLLQEFLPTLEEFGDLFGFLNEAEPQTIVVEPQPAPVSEPWYQGIPPWAWGVAAAVGTVFVLKLLED